MTASGAPSTGRDETPDEALRASVARALYGQRHAFQHPHTPPSVVADILADAVLAVVLSPERDEQLRQEGRDEERARIAGQVRSRADETIIFAEGLTSPDLAGFAKSLMRTGTTWDRLAYWIEENQ